MQNNVISTGVRNQFLMNASVLKQRTKSFNLINKYTSKSMTDFDATKIL